MVTRIFSPLLILLASLSFAQQKTDFTAYGPIKGNLAINQGFMLQHKITDLYLSGNLEYFPEKNVSVRGDCFWYIDARQKNPVLKQNIMVLFGALAHLPKGRSDFYAGVQPGITFTKPNNPDNNVDVALQTRLMPVLSISAGYTLYFSRFCNFFLAANYMISRYRGAPTGTIKLDEIMISGGLGFHFNTRKQVKM
jgi:hypothetical protein